MTAPQFCIEGCEVSFTDEGITIKPAAGGWGAPPRFRFNNVLGAGNHVGAKITVLDADGSFMFSLGGTAAVTVETGGRVRQASGR